MAATISVALTAAFLSLAGGTFPVAAFFVSGIYALLAYAMLWALGLVTEEVIKVKGRSGHAGYKKDLGWCQICFVLLNLLLVSMGIGVAIYLGVKCKDDATPEECLAVLPYVGNGTVG